MLFTSFLLCLTISGVTGGEGNSPRGGTCKGDELRGGTLMEKKNFSFVSFFVLRKAFQSQSITFNNAKSINILSFQFFN